MATEDLFEQPLALSLRSIMPGVKEVLKAQAWTVAGHDLVPVFQEEL